MQVVEVVNRQINSIVQRAKPGEQVIPDEAPRTAKQPLPLKSPHVRFVSVSVELVLN
jgi:hypothetical protein